MATVTIEPERTAGDTNLARSRTNDSGATVLEAGGQTVPFSYTYGQTFAVLGDSISEQNYTGDDFSEKGYAIWASILSNGGLVFKQSLNFGVSGDKAAETLLRVDDVIAAAPSFCAVLIGTNDIGTGAGGAVTPYASMIASIEAIYDALLGAGICVIAIPILPKSDAAQSTTKQAQLNRVNTWIRRYCFNSTDKIILADPFESLVDYTLTTGVPIGGHANGTTAMTTDGVHPTKRGAWLIGKTIIDALGSRISPIKLIQYNTNDIYDATNNPTGNLLANGLFTGTTGTDGQGASGDFGTGWTAASTVATGTMVGSKVNKTLANGQTIPQQQIVYAAPAGASLETFGLTSATITTGFTAGVDTIYGDIEVSVSGITADSFISIEYAIGDGTATVNSSLKSTNGFLPNVEWSGVLRTPEFVITAGATALFGRLRVYIDGTVASAGVTVTAGRASIRKV